MFVLFMLCIYTIVLSIVGAISYCYVEYRLNKALDDEGATEDMF